MTTRQFDADVLASGQISNAEAAIYTAPSGGTDKGAYVKRVTIYNTSATPQTVRFWVKPSGGTARRIAPRYVLEQDEGAELVGNGQSIILGPGDALEAASTTTNVVDFVVHGVTETEV